jgi:membrane-associated protease RseP (regulator of RpoE activity)
MSPDDFEKRTGNLVPLLGDLFTIDSTYRHEDKLVLSMSYRYDPVQSRKLVSDRLRLAGYRYSLQDSENILLLEIDPKPRVRVPALNIILFAVTLLSVYFIPVFYRYLPAAQTIRQVFINTLQALGRGEGLVFTAAIISILLVHEMGHFVASRRRGIITSWPYFIPAPNIIGTFGAVIKSKSPFWNRRDLIEVGAAGPIAGWIVALGWLIFGLAHSSVVTFPTGGMEFSLAGESLLMRFLATTIVGSTPAGSWYFLTEAAFAGWVGLLVTAINLLPIGQLDGGHIVYGLGRRVQVMLGYAAMGALLLLGFQSPIWWFFGAFGLIFGVKHPSTRDDGRKLSRPAVIMGIAAIVIFVLSFTPVPFRAP